MFTDELRSSRNAHPVALRPLTHARLHFARGARGFVSKKWQCPSDVFSRIIAVPGMACRADAGPFPSRRRRGPGAAQRSHGARLPAAAARAGLAVSAPG